MFAGPVTPAGKANSSKNARKGGLFINDNTLLQEESGEIADILAVQEDDRRGEPLGVDGAQVVCVRFVRVAGGSENGHRVRVHVGQRGHRISGARDTGTRSGQHRAQTIGAPAT